MVFPATVLQAKVEINVGSWVDITSYAMNREGVSIRRGRANEQAGFEPSGATMSLNNRDGRFSPRNPASPYFGVIGRNTPIRVSLPYGTSYLATNQSTGLTVGSAYVTTPDAAALDIVGDIDLRFEADLDSWAPVTALDLVSKWNTTGNQRSYAMWLDQGYLKLSRSTDGTIGGTGTATSTARVPITSGRIAVRATLDVNDGAGNRVTTFYTSDSISGTWTQLGNSITTSGVIAIFASTAPLRLLDNPTADLGLDSVAGKVFKAQVLSGIAGSAVANPDFTIQTAGATSFADSAGRTWTVTGTPTIDDRDYRFTGEVTSWPQKWDTSGSDIWTDIECSGIMRRLGQGASQLPSPWTRLLKSKTDTVAYWPVEDGENSTVVGSGLPSGSPMTVLGSPEYADYQGVFVATRPIMTLGFARLYGRVPRYTDTNTIQFTMYLAVPAAGIANGIIVASIATAGSVGSVQLIYGTGGTLAARAYDSEGVLILTGPAIGFGVNGDDLIVSMSIKQNGGNVDVQLQTYDIVAGGFFTSAASSIASQTIDRALTVTINPEQRMDQVSVGQIAVSSSDWFITSTALSVATAYTGESAGARFTRLCTENGVAYTVVGNLIAGEAMGYQPFGTLLELLKECAVVDDGILFEPRDLYGLGMRVRAGLYHQVVTATASYATNQLATLEPVEDDSAIRNDVTVTRKGGTSARVAQTTGPLSTSAAPTGIGVYDDELTLSLALDGQAEPQAAWRLATGTINEPRYPQIEFNFTNPAVVADSTLTTALGRIDIGDRLQVTSPPTWGSRETISQLAQGYTEYLNNFERVLTVNCSPATVHNAIGVYSAATVAGGGQSKYSSDGSTLAASYNSTVTTFSVATATGPVWTTAAAQMPIQMIVAGEQVTVTAISGTSSPQTFTVTRSVNGVVKSQASGATIALLTPAKYAL